MSDGKKFIVMGPVGSGKTTQAKLLAQHLSIPLIDTGEILRTTQKTTELGKKVKDLIDKGKYVPDEIMLTLIAEEITKPESQNGFVMTGSPRTMAQAEKLPFEPGAVVYLVVSDPENTRRLLGRGRDDDTPELIAERLEIYHRETEPILAFYRQKGKLLEIEGERPIDIIFEDVLQKLKL